MLKSGLLEAALLACWAAQVVTSSIVFSEIKNEERFITLECLPISQCQPYNGILDDLESSEQPISPQGSASGAFDFCDPGNNATNSGLGSFGNVTATLGVLCPIQTEEPTQPRDDCNCVVVGECQELVELIRKRQFETLTASYEACGFQGATPMFCCPDQKNPGVVMSQEILKWSPTS